jgi:hypothetical protein
MFQQQQKPLDIEKLEENKNVYKKNYKPLMINQKPKNTNYKKNYKKKLFIDQETHPEKCSEEKEICKEICQEKCQEHDYIKTHGITTCSRCPFKSIKYLMPLEKLDVVVLSEKELPVILKTKKKYYRNYKNKPK